MNNVTALPKQTVIKEWLINQIAEQFEKEPEAIDADQPFIQYGLDSIVAFTIVGDLEEWLEEEFTELEIPATLMWDYPTINKVTEYIVAELESAEEN